MNILIVKLSAIGDVIHTLPALNALRQAFPQAGISWLVEEDAAPLVEGHQALDEVIVSKRKKWIKNLFGPQPYLEFKDICGFLKRLRSEHFDLILDFQALLKSAALIGWCKGKRKVGFDRGMEHMECSYFFLNERIPPVDMNIHALKRNMMLLEAVGIRTDEIRYHLPMGDDHRMKARHLITAHCLNQSAPLIAVNPIAKWNTKLWDNRKFALLADHLIKTYGSRIYFTGSRTDRPAVSDILFQMKEKAVNLAGETDLKTLAALYEKTDLVISTDTGPMHLAAAVGSPVIALFGPTSPRRTGPYGSLNTVVRSPKPCSPCFKRECETVSCMKEITVDQVMDAVGEITAKKGIGVRRG